MVKPRQPEWYFQLDYKLIQQYLQTPAQHVPLQVDAGPDKHDVTLLIIHGGQAHVCGLLYFPRD